MNFQYISNIFPIVSYKGASSGLHVCDGLGNLGMKKSITVLVLIDEVHTEIFIPSNPSHF